MKFINAQTRVFLYLFVSFSLSCATNKHGSESRQETPAKSPTPPVSAAVAQPSSDTKEENHGAAPATSAEHTQNTHKSDEHARKAGPVSSTQALGWLKNGNTRYLKGNLRKDGQGKKDIDRLAVGQSPHSIVLSCSDSRVPPEVIFDQKLGEIFVVRAAGEALDSSVIASIEYAIAHLGSNLIVVMGHSSCGAVKAAHLTLNGADAGSPWLNKLVADIHPRIKPLSTTEHSKDYVDEAWANVHGISKDLLQRSQIIKDAVAIGEVRITSALYHLDSGAVEWKE